MTKKKRKPTPLPLQHRNGKKALVKDRPDYKETKRNVKLTDLRNRKPETYEVVDVQKFWQGTVSIETLNKIVERLIDLTTPKYSEAARLRASELILHYRLGKPREQGAEGQLSPVITIEHNIIKVDPK
jgi:hypothetical protein